jgi:TRAP transporter TAXI family solute receptor
MALRMSLKHFAQNHWPSIAIAAATAVIAFAALVMLFTLPPRSIVMATGPEGGNYYELGERYRKVLADEGVKVQLLPTAGSAENLAKLRDPNSGVSVALMQGGVISQKTASGLESLGTIFYEPYWWFRRSEIKEEGVAGLRGRKISIGPEGSGTQALSLPMLARAGINGQNSELLSLSPRATAEKLLAGDIDAAFLVASWQSPVVQQLLTDDRVVLSGYARADALVALYPFLTKLVVPRGVVDLAKDKPPSDVTLIASKASLVVRGDLHPAIQYLLLNAASEIHSRDTIFNRGNEFPAAEGVELPLSSEALRYYKSGLPFLHEYFTFWVAELIGRLAILLIPIFGVLLPMMHFLPRIYDWAMRSRILRLYGELRLLEDETSRAQASDKHAMIAQLGRLEEQVNHLKMPVAYANMLYELRAHIELVREGLKKHADFKESAPTQLSRFR